MDSYFLAEMFKYLYLLFTPPDETVGIQIEDYVLTTEAHILPLKLALENKFNGNFTFEQVNIIALYVIGHRALATSTQFKDPEFHF